MELREARPHELGKGRIEALSDGIFAVAMTLLIFEFKVPDLPHDASNVAVAPALLRLWPRFVTYAVSFASLGMFWIGHHNMYHAIRRSNRMLMALNILFFMFVSFVPFATSVLNSFLETQAGLLFFGANLTIIGWILFAQWVYASGQEDMISGHVSAAYCKLVRNRFLAYPVVVTLVMAFCFWSVSLSLVFYLTLLPLYLIPGMAKQSEEDSVAESLTPRMQADDGLDYWPAQEDAETAIGSVSSVPAATETVSRGQVAGRHLMIDRRVFFGAAGALCVLIGWLAFRPELVFINHKTHEAFPTANGMVDGTATKLSAGIFHGVAHETHGDAAIYRLKNGKRILRLENFSTSNGPDVRVLLIGATDAKDNNAVTRSGFTEIAKLKGNEGDQNYELPNDLDLAKYHAVTIWCNRFDVNFATAPLAAHG